jgi:hypothetical protein
MRIYVLPVSGGGFPAQLGLLREIYRATMTDSEPGITPDLVFASSGGNVAAYLAMANNWTDVGIIKNGQMVDSNVFVESWTPSFFPTWIAFPMTRSIYRTGKGVDDLFQSFYTCQSIQKTEIWTGTYNNSSQRAALFCNKSFEEAKIKDNKVETYIYDSEPLHYLSGNVDTIGKVCYASASIPYLTPGIIIDNERHIDGGVSYASPLIPMSNYLSQTISRLPAIEKIQIHYFCSYDMSEKFSDSIYSQSIGLLIHSSLLQDRAFTLSLLRQYGKVSPSPEVYLKLTTQTLRLLLSQIKEKSYALFLFPDGSPSVAMTSFRGKDILNVIKTVEKGYNAFLWILERRL